MQYPVGLPSHTVVVGCVVARSPPPRLVRVTVGYTEPTEEHLTPMDTAHHDGTPADHLLVEVSIESDEFTLRVSGALDMDSVGSFLATTIALLDEHEPGELVLSVEGLSFVDSSGLRSFLEIREETRRRAISLHLRRATSATEKLLAMVGLDETLEPVEQRDR